VRQTYLAKAVRFTVCEYQSGIVQISGNLFHFVSLIQRSLEILPHRCVTLLSTFLPLFFLPTYIFLSTLIDSFICPR